MRRALALAVVLTSAVPAWAQDEDEEEDASGDADEEPGEEEEPEEAEPTGKDATSDDEEAEDLPDDGLPPKQNLTGHDLGTKKRENEFEKERFFVDKVDSEKTEDGTLVQGSITSSSFFYRESGGEYPLAPNADALGPETPIGDNAGPTRMFTELRLQTDFRHIAGSRWEARFDGRARYVPQPPNDALVAPNTVRVATADNRIQSGFLGENELDIRELWLIRSGKRADVFIGRQFVPDLGGVKFDGLRVDYAKSAKLTFIGFGGLYPVRGSRSITTDYPQLKTEDGNSAGRFVATGGFGGAYRTVNAYGAIGGVTMAPLQKESPRVYVTSTGYLRNGAKVDFFHFVLVDLLGSGAAESTARVQLTNLSAGVNFKPNPRLRLNAAFHRVDTESLNVQAATFLSAPDNVETGVGPGIVQSESYLARLAHNTARAGVSAGLGHQQRYEISTALTFRQRPEFELRAPNKMVVATLKEARSVEVWGSFVDRRSVKDLRIGIEGSKSFAAGDIAFQRSELLLGRLFVNRLIQSGRGEWEAEASYSQVKNTIIGTVVSCASIEDCYGRSNNTLFSIGGQLFYRIRNDWFGIGTLHLMRVTNVRSDDVTDPAINTLTGWMRIAKRF